MEILKDYLRLGGGGGVLCQTRLTETARLSLLLSAGGAEFVRACITLLADVDLAIAPGVLLGVTVMTTAVPLFKWHAVDMLPPSQAWVWSGAK